MKAQPDVERLISDWLTEVAPPRAPGRVLAAVAERLDRSTNPRGSRLRGVQLAGVGRLVGIAAVVTILLAGVTLSGVLPPPSGTVPGGVASTPGGGTSPAPSPTSSPTDAPTPTETPSASPTTRPAWVDNACVLTAAEVKAATQTTWDLTARPGSYLDGDPSCHYEAPGHTYVNGGVEETVPVAIIEWMTAPNMISYWSARSQGVIGQDVPVRGAKAVWIKADHTLVIDKGGQLVTFAFVPDPTVQIDVALQGLTVGSLERATMLVQTFADRMP